MVESFDCFPMLLSQNVSSQHCDGSSMTIMVDIMVYFLLQLFANLAVPKSESL